MKPSIIFLIPYFGKLPSYFDSFIQTIVDKELDIIFFSDIKRPENLPSNVKWHFFTLEELRLFFEERLEHTIELKSAYKLCDFKPAYGYLFDQFTHGYQFWGVMDLDICLGNLEKYLNEKALKTFDVYSGIKEYISGCFFIVRNNDRCNLLFKKSRDWEYVFTNDSYLGFDECGGQFFEELKAGKSFAEIGSPIESFTEILLKENKWTTRIKFENHVIEPKRGITSVNKCSILYNEKEYLLVHFIYYKSWYFFYTNKRVRLPFYINRLGFFQYKPVFLNILLSRNIRFGLQQKLNINIRKLRLRA